MEVGHVARYGRSWIAVEFTSKNVYLLHAGAPLKPYISSEDGGVAGNPPFAFDHYAAEKGGDIAVHPSAHSDAATEAGDIRCRLSRADGDVVAELSAVVGIVRES